MTIKLKKAGFTLMEMLIIVSITGLILPTLFSIIFTLLRLQFQVKQLQRLKETGDLLTNQIIYTVKQHAVLVDDSSQPDSCASIFATEITDSSSYLFFKTRRDKCFGYYVKDQKLELIAEPSTEITSATLLTEDDTDISITVNSAQMQIIQEDLAKFKLALKTQETVKYLPSQQLSYQFYIYIRK